MTITMINGSLSLVDEIPRVAAHGVIRCSLVPLTTDAGLPAVLTIVFGDGTEMHFNVDEVCASYGGSLGHYRWLSEAAAKAFAAVLESKR